MAKISREEYWFLNGLNDGWKWIAKDKNTDLWVYEKEPRKHKDLWDEFSGVCEEIDSALFQFIQWGDEEPYSIPELIEEYEKESEETEMKSKQDLIEKWESAIESAEFYGKGKEEELIGYMKDFVGDLNQLEEPEVLSQEWIDEHAKAVAYDGIPDETEIVYVDELQSLLVPKQEETNDDLYILKVGGGYMTDFELTVGRVTSFSRESEYGADVVRASKPFMEFIQKQVGGELHNITNPEEQKYIVKLPLPGNETNDFAVVDIYGDIWLDGEWPSHYKMTEKEIKALPKGEVYFEHFAVKVEELEE